MPDLDQRVADGLRDLVGRAPVDADVWPATEKYVAKRRRQRHGAVGGLLAVALLAGGLVTVGLVRGAHSNVTVSDRGPSGDTRSPLSASGPVDGAFTITASPSGGLTFEPASITVPTGVYAVALKAGSATQHTLDFEDPNTLWSELIVNNLGEMKTTRVFFGRPGDYTFFCAVPGHREAGMGGVVHVIGSPVTLAQAEATAAAEGATTSVSR